MKNVIHTHTLYQKDYQEIWEKMRLYTKERTSNSLDEIWLLEHPPVYTLGQAGLMSHILSPGKIPIVKTDRGGQVTYHGPGQLVMYTLFDLNHFNIGTSAFVKKLESSIIELLSLYQITGHLIDKAPGVYVNNKKIASIGLRVSKGYTYHGISLNVDMDLTPFNYINPCGHQNLKMTSLKQEKPQIEWDLWQIGSELSNLVAILLEKNNFHFYERNQQA